MLNPNDIILYPKDKRYFCPIDECSYSTTIGHRSDLLKHLETYHQAPGYKFPPKKKSIETKSISKNYQK
jgi:hypothetical protein